jgi:hypothetical protein
VNWLRTRFGLDHRIIPPCWYQHPALIDLLTALRDHHRLAYDPVQPASGATDWHRTFRDLEPRLRDWASRTSCTPDTHRLDQPIPAPDDSVHWEQHQHADIRRRQQDEGERTP